ncbi:Dynamin [Penicillium brevicompactum]|uniref:Dynamin n=1 Tax=Penicillium brevicompactum TaxID=5074 RepID=UPI002540CB8F|nr:Dynamin [Penicillium brevicompactum]KAJ5348481.1 Dynamin [Penicillium brevicompactum]
MVVVVLRLPVNFFFHSHFPPPSSTILLGHLEHLPPALIDVQFVSSYSTSPVCDSLSMVTTAVMAPKEPAPAGNALADPTLLRKIDELYACGVGEYVDLPQLVVVGDQSSGKSSVLEGLTKVNFPRDSGLCTCFMTQIIFRRELRLSERAISASIIPSAESDPNEQQRMRSWRASGLQSLRPDEFMRTMGEVHEHMGLSTAEDDGRPTFSKSVLQLVIEGPNENHLTVIDVPGIFKNTTSGRTTKNDIELVRNMTLQCIANPLSIILAVVPANVDIATQEIIELARDIDPEELRTMKIITKPDLVDKGAEDKIVKLINEGNAKGQMGWLLVRNLSQKEMDDGNVNRDDAEMMFHETLPWYHVASENYGIEALKTRLQELHTMTVRREFPKVRNQITQRLNEAKEALSALGDKRDKPEQQRRVLLQVVSAFQEITQLAISTNYGAHRIFDENQFVRLATLISTRNALFSDDIDSYGNTHAFGSKEGDSPHAPKTTSSRKYRESLDIGEILTEGELVESSQQFTVFPWIKETYENARGFEIGTFNHNIVSTLMKKQTSKWPALSWGYISDIISYVHVFVQTVLQEVCKNRQICGRILSMLREDLIQSYTQAISMVDFLLAIEREGTPLTMNHYLNDSLEKCRQKRLQDEVSSKSLSGCQHGEVIRISDLAAQHHMSNVDHTVQDIHDILESYYRVSRKRFVDNICMQAVDHYLLTGPGAPMKLLSSTWVNDLTVEKLEQIAGEEAGTKRKRRQLQMRIEKLEAGRKVVLL